MTIIWIILAVIAVLLIIAEVFGYQRRKIEKKLGINTIDELLKRDLKKKLDKEKIKK